jgi:C4-dicarboxylate transporter, DctQ subunit
MEAIATGGGSGGAGSKYARLLDLFAALAGAMIIFAMTSVTVDVLLRATGSGSLTWSFEVTEFLLLYIPMLTMPWLARRRGHITIDVVISRLDPMIARRLEVVVDFLVAAVCAFVTYWGVIATWNAYSRGIVNAGMVEYPRWALLISIPFGFGLTAIEYLRLCRMALAEERRR